MATINSAVFNAGSGGTVAVFNPGDSMQLTVNYTADVPGVTATAFNATTTITNASTNQVTATQVTPFTVDTPQANGDTAATSDDGGRTWTEGATSPQADGSLQVVFSATA